MHAQGTMGIVMISGQAREVVGGAMETKGRLDLRVTNGLGLAMRVTRDEGVEEGEEEGFPQILTMSVVGAEGSEQATEVSEGRGTKMCNDLMTLFKIGIT